MARQVAHEIKNPLTPMKLMLQQLQATARADPAAAARAIEETARVVLEQVDALARIAGDFSAFARFPPRRVVDADVGAMLRSVAALYAGSEQGRAEVEASPAEGLPAVRWDADELRRVFVNLVANAVQALDEAKGRVRVRIRAARAPDPATGRDGVRVEVEDDGVGIREGDRGRLFEPDFSTKTGGTGLGLAIVKRILADLGGDIRIDSTPGKGTVVTVWMPAASAGGPVPPGPEDGGGRL
jgi:signal transduction histidine kinase